MNQPDEIPDWSREQPRQFWDPGRRLLSTIRQYQHCHDRGAIASRLACKLIVAQYRFWSIVTGADIPLKCQIGGGLLLPHPNGIVIHPMAKIGVNCLIFQQVTIGQRDGIEGTPIIEDRVDIGAGAKILGRLRIGRDAKIGANAVVLCDVPPGATAVGIPATIKASH